MATLKSEKKIYIRQPAYLPGLVFFDQMLQVDIYVIYDNVQYERRHFGNRNKIRTSSDWQWLTVPVIQKGKRDQWYMDTIINNEHSWGNKHWKAILYNYAQAPHFRKYAGFFEDLYKQPWTNLRDLDIKIIEFIKEQLSIKTKIILASSLRTGTQFDNKTERLAQIVEELGGKTYITCKGTRGYIDDLCMQQHGITLLWHQFTHPIYKQFQGGNFIENMSAIDLLFNYGDEGGEIIRRNMQSPLTEYNPKPL